VARIAAHRRNLSPATMAKAENSGIWRQWRSGSGVGMKRRKWRCSASKENHGASAYLAAWLYAMA